MKDMDKAVERLDRAIAQDEKILIYGDYDVDGTTAVALLYKYLKSRCHYENLEYYIPDRYTEGYGVSIKGIDYAAQNGFSLMLITDCGIKAVEKVKYACSQKSRRYHLRPPYTRRLSPGSSGSTGPSTERLSVSLQMAERVWSKFQTGASP